MQPIATDLKGSDVIIVATVPMQCFERVDAVTRVTRGARGARVTRTPTLSRVTTLCRHFVGGEKGDKRDQSDENAKVVKINDKVTK